MSPSSPTCFFWQASARAFAMTRPPRTPTSLQAAPSPAGCPIFAGARQRSGEDGKPQSPLHRQQARRLVKPPQPNISPNSLIPLSKKFAPFCMFFLANAHTKNISLRTAPTGPRSQAFSLQETAPCRRTTPSPTPVAVPRRHSDQNVRDASGPYRKKNKYPPPSSLN